MDNDDKLLSIVKTLHKKNVKINKLQNKIESKQDEINHLFCQLFKNFVDNDFDSVIIDDILLVLMVSIGSTSVYEVIVVEKTDTHIRCRASQNSYISMYKHDDCDRSLGSTFISQNTYKIVDEILNPYRQERKF